jgi:two-component system sensor histidine kinase RegB
MSQGRSFSLRQDRYQWLRLRSSVVLRWFAICGQITALFVAQFGFGINLPLGLCYFVIGLAIAANLLASQVFPENKRLSETEAIVTLVFDLSQPTLLLFLTGGLNNPFALLILAPVTVSASALNLRATISIGALAGAFTTLLFFFRLPLLDEMGAELEIPKLFAFGFWISLLIGICFIAIYLRRISTEMHSMADALLATQLALAREQKLTDLGGVVAAAAHELGTPLSTIKLVSSELIDELKGFPALQDDARLLLQQAERCKDILRSMGKSGKDDLLVKQMPIGALLREAAEPHLDRGKQVIFEIGDPETGGQTQPIINRRPELIHGIRNLVQNAVDFSATSVFVNVAWGADFITLRIIDDGPGFSPQILGRIGDPFVSSRKFKSTVPSVPEYEGMGLGLFIAKTLLERTGAELSFANTLVPDASSSLEHVHRGAIVEVTWPIRLLEVQIKGALGVNKEIKL